VLPPASAPLLLLLDAVAPLLVLPLLEGVEPPLPEPALVWLPEPVCVVVPCREASSTPGEELLAQAIGASRVAEIKTSDLGCLRCIRRSSEGKGKAAS
jgi:hypothetical protein